MNKLEIWIPTLFVVIAINAFLYGYSLSLRNNSISEDSFVKAEQTERQEPLISITPVNVNNTRIEVLFTGDVMLGRTVMTKSKEFNDYLYPFRRTANRLSSADLTVINLENPIVEECPVHEGGFKFCSEPDSVQALTYSGVDIANLANNHTYNWGRDGFDQTIEYLDGKDIKSIGYDNVEYVNKKDTILAFLGFDFVTNPYTLSSKQTEIIKEADMRSDLLIVNVHWGNEYKASANRHQRAMARELIGLGVDMIVGHHPHWVQDVECFVRDEDNADNDNDGLLLSDSLTAKQLRQGKGCSSGTIPVYYSLGNFVFDQMWSEETKKGGALEITFEKSDFVEDHFYPTYISEWAQPEWVSTTGR